ncbi:MAG: nicotinate-nucleotide adenylyltransferase [Geminicoccaceae bacterium]
MNDLTLLRSPRRPVVFSSALKRPTKREPKPTGRKRRIGILGGSFNPAHEGHLHLSSQALKRLALDQLWWLVSPQNPLKSRDETAAWETRLRAARAVARDPRIRVSELEAQFPDSYTVNSLFRIRRRWPDTHFVWLMGADNLATLHRWYRWRTIMEFVPVAVFDRDPYSYKGVNGVAASAYADDRWPAERSSELAEAAPPAWCLLRLRKHPAASRSIRAERGWLGEHSKEKLP